MTTVREPILVGYESEVLMVFTRLLIEAIAFFEGLVYTNHLPPSFMRP